MDRLRPAVLTNYILCPLFGYLLTFIGLSKTLAIPTKMTQDLLKKISNRNYFNITKRNFEEMHRIS